MTLGPKNYMQISGTRATINVQAGKVSKVVNDRVEVIHRSGVNVNRLPACMGPSDALGFSFPTFSFYIVCIVFYS